MSIDIIIIVLLIVLAILGYLRGFIRGIINLIFGLAYLFFSSNLLNLGLNGLGNEQISKEVANNDFFKYIVVIALGAVLSIILNIVLSKFLKKGVVSKFDKIAGVIVHVLVGYCVICVFYVIYWFIAPFMEVPDSFKDSFFLSQNFQTYNFIYWWWLK